MAQQTESQLHEAVCNYIRLQYPNVLFNSDMSGVKLTIGQAIKAKKLRSSKGFPDLVIYESRRGYSALFIELKKEGEKLYKKDGITPRTPHLLEQWNILQDLEERWFSAQFACGFDEAKKIIDYYFN